MPMVFVADPAVAEEDVRATVKRVAGQLTLTGPELLAPPAGVPARFVAFAAPAPSACVLWSVDC